MTDLIEALESATELCDYDLLILRVLNGEDVPGLMWGAAMSSACGYLKSMGYATGMYEITDKGRAALKARETT